MIGRHGENHHCVGLRGLSERASMELEGSGCREEYGERLKYSRAFLELTWYFAGP